MCRVGACLSLVQEYKLQGCHLMWSLFFLKLLCSNTRWMVMWLTSIGRTQLPLLLTYAFRRTLHWAMGWGGVQVESTRSPSGVLEESTGVQAESKPSPWGVHLESKPSPWGVHLESTWSPSRVHPESMWKWTLWLGTFSKSETKCNMRSRTPDHTIYDYVITFFWAA